MGIVRHCSIQYPQIKYLSFQSLEITALSPKIMDILLNEYMDSNTLVIGPKLIDQQSVTTKTDQDTVTITGNNIPWNTLNVWDLDKLKQFGFSLISDGIF